MRVTTVRALRECLCYLVPCSASFALAVSLVFCCGKDYRYLVSSYELESKLTVVAIDIIIVG